MDQGVTVRAASSANTAVRTPAKAVPPRTRSGGREEKGLEARVTRRDSGIILVCISSINSDRPAKMAAVGGQWRLTARGHFCLPS
jgi:hypothetical protein